MARSGMTALLEELRGLVEAGTADYSVGTTSYWSDNTLQDMLDLHRRDLRFQQLSPSPTQVSGGTLLWNDYYAPYGFLESTTGGTAIFYLQDSTGATLGTALWNMDYRRGLASFVSDAKGTTVYLTGRAYDLNAAAADIWRKKAAHYAPTSFDFSTDNHSVSRDQVYAHAVDMVKFFEGISGGSIQTVERYRSDM